MKAKSICFTAAVFFLCTAFSSGISVAAEPAASVGPSPTVAAFNRADFKEALRLARPLAQKGDAEAEHILGLMYSSGFGVEQDFVQAAAWYEKAAVQGVEAAQNNLGSLYAQGQGVPQDYAKAAYWFRKAADQGAAQSCYNLGTLYENGQGVPQDYKEAAAWYRRAAEAALEHWYRENMPHH